MADESRVVSIHRRDLAKANSAFGLKEEDFDLSKARVSIGRTPLELQHREKGVLSAKVSSSLGDGPWTIVVTADNDKFLGVLDLIYDLQSQTFKMKKQEAEQEDSTLDRVVDKAADKIASAIRDAALALGHKDAKEHVK